MRHPPILTPHMVLDGQKKAKCCIGRLSLGLPILCDNLNCGCGVQDTQVPGSYFNGFEETKIA